MSNVIDQAWFTQAATELCQWVDWDHPTLADQPALAAYRRGQHADAALLLVRHLRARQAPRLNYDTAYVERLRSLASDTERAEARQRVVRALEVGTGDKRSFDSIGKLPDEAVFLTDDAQLYEAMGPLFLEEALKEAEAAAGDGRHRRDWGTAMMLAKLTQRLWVTPECPDEVLAPLLAWCAGQTLAEWRWARTWDEGILGSASHNWWLTTFFGIWMQGMLLPELKGLEPFRDLAPCMLERCVLLIFRSDGFTREQSGYQFGSLMHALEWAHQAERNGFEIKPEVWQRLADAAAAHWKILAPDADIPHWGDGYRGVRKEQPIPEVLRLQAARFGLGEVKYLDQLRSPDWKPHYPGFLPLFGQNLLPAYEALEPVAPPLDTHLPDSQYYVMRTDWTDRADWCALDAGRRGKTGTSHAHNALLNMVLYSHGRSVLLDNGAGPYGKSPARMWRRSSVAHNVATVDELDHLEMPSEWRFTSQDYPLVDAWITEPEYTYWSASHEGYGRLNPETGRIAYCRRKLFWLRGQYWILIDRFTRDWWPKRYNHKFDLNFHMPAPITLGPDGRAWSAGDGGNLLIVPVPGLSGEASVTPCPYPLEGYDNPDHLRYRLETDQEPLFATLLVPYEGATPPEVKASPVEVRIHGEPVAAREVTGLQIELGGETHLYVEQHMHWTQPWESQGTSGKGRVYHSAVRNLRQAT